MIYYATKKKNKIKKYRRNINQNGQNYSIYHYIYQGKLQISLKYSNNNSDEIFDYTNFYSYHQLQIINKYFRYFDNLEQISSDLDKLLKQNQVVIEEKIGFVIISISVLVNNEPTNIIFKLLKNKIIDFSGNTYKISNYYSKYKNNNNYYNYTKETNNNSLSMPKYGKETKELKHYNNNLNEKDSAIESIENKYEESPKEIVNKRNLNNINANKDKTLMNNINNILTKINKLEQENQEKDYKIKNLENEVNKYDLNMSYPIYSIANESQLSKNEKDNENSNDKKNKNLNEFDDENEKINKINNINEINSKPYAFQQIEENIEKISENNNKLNKKKKLSESVNDESSKNLKKLKNKNISKSQRNFIKKKNSNSSISNKELDLESGIKDSNNSRIKGSKNRSLGKKDKNSMRKKEEEKVSELSVKKSENSITNESKHKLKKKKKNYSINNSNSSSIEEEDENLNEEKKINKKEKKNSKKTKNKYSDFSYDTSEEKKNQKNKITNESDSSLSDEENSKKKRKRRDSSSSREKFSKDKNNKKRNNKSKIEKNGLPMVEREDLKSYINSRIFFTKKELQKIKSKITKERRHLHTYFDLLYRASIDGDYEDKIISLCEGYYPQLVLFYTEEGARFGVYIEKEKNVNFFGKVSYKEIPSTSFLFGLNTMTIYDIEKGKKATDDMDEKLCFGRSFYYNDNETNWLIYTPKNNFLNLQLLIGDKVSNFGMIDTHKIIGINRDYHLKDVEIFKVKVYPNDDEENKNNNL